MRLTQSVGLVMCFVYIQLAHQVPAYCGVILPLPPLIEALAIFHTLFNYINIW